MFEITPIFQYVIKQINNILIADTTTASITRNVVEQVSILLDRIAKIMFCKSLTKIPSRIISSINLHRNDFVNLVIVFPPYYSTVYSIVLLMGVYSPVSA